MPDAKKQHAEKIAKAVKIISLIAVLIVNAVFLRFNAFRAFKFFDMGLFLDGAWRIFTGQRPYIDFLWQTTPLHLYMHVFFFKLFGFGKTAILAHILSVSSLVIGAVFLAARKRLPPFALFVALCLTMTCFYWPWAHPWYAHSAHLWGILGAAALSLRLPFKNAKSAFLFGGLAGLMAMISFMTKPNIGLAHAMLLGSVCLVSPRRTKAIAGFLSGGGLALLAVKIFFIGSWTNFMDQAVFTYGYGERGRLSCLTCVPLYFENFYWLIAIPVLLDIRTHLRKNRELLALFLGLWPVAIFSTFTSGAIFQSDVQLVGLYGALALILVYKERRTGQEKWQAFLHAAIRGALLTGLSALAVLYGIYGFQIKAWSLNDIKTFPGIPYNPIGDYAMKAKPFEGWLCKRNQGASVDGLVEFINTSVPKQDSLLILTDLYILNALTGRDSYRHISCVWTINVVPAPGKQLAQIRAAILDNPPQWIVTHRGPVAFIQQIVSYLDLAGFIQKHYQMAGIWGNYVMLKKVT